MLDDNSQELMGIRLAEVKIKKLPKFSISFFSILPRALALSRNCLQSCDILEYLKSPDIHQTGVCVFMQ